jgi:hypothetical protein
MTLNQLIKYCTNKGISLDSHLISSGHSPSFIFSGFDHYEEHAIVKENGEIMYADEDDPEAKVYLFLALTNKRPAYKVDISK